MLRVEGFAFAGGISWAFFTDGPHPILFKIYNDYETFLS